MEQLEEVRLCLIVRDNLVHWLFDRELSVWDSLKIYLSELHPLHHVDEIFMVQNTVTRLLPTIEYVLIPFSDDEKYTLCLEYFIGNLQTVHRGAAKSLELSNREMQAWIDGK
jgi:hypothetical protein